MKQHSFLFSLLFLCLSAQAHTHHLDASWYPQQPAELKKTIQKLFAQAEQHYDAILDPKKIRAILVPHAAYAYSGTVAASVYRLLDAATIDKVILLAPAHTASYTGIALPSFDTYQTPLGNVSISTEDVHILEQEPLCFIHNTAFDQEHSLEIQLPLLQSVINKKTPIIPLLVGKLGVDSSRKLAKIIKPLITPRTLVIISSDFTHYGKAFDFTPFRDNVYARIRHLDGQAITIIQEQKLEPFKKFIEKTGATICGIYPLYLFLALCELNAFGALEPRLIAYDTSNKDTKNVQHSVSYVGMLFTHERLASRPFEQQLTQYEQRSLYQEARDVLENMFKDSNNVPAELLFTLPSYGLSRPLGAFTTLKKKTKAGEELRGCIGRIVTSEPLYKTIAQVTQDTALHDSRFTPVTQQELPTLSLSLSVLSPTKSISSYRDIIVGTHGVILDHHGASAVFLPEVAPEFGWTREQMLEQLSLKAGLPADAWRQKDTHFEVFTSISIAE